MSQNDFNIANQGFPSFRSDLNSALQALASTSSGATAPATPYANQLWYDTATDLLKIRNEANSDWINLFGVSTDGFVIEDKIIHSGDTNTAIRFPADDTVTVETGGTERMRIDSSGNLLVGKTSQTGTGVGIELEADGTFYVGKTGDVATFNRATSVDGTIVDFQKQGTTVGSIGYISSGLYIDGESGHAGLRFGGADISPRDGGADADAAIQLGSPSNRFTDIYLSGNAYVGDKIIHDGDTNTAIRFPAADTVTVETAGSERMRIDSLGTALVGKTASNIGTAGVELYGDGTVYSTVSANTCVVVNRLANDGTLVSFRQAGTQEGSISVSGTTVSYNGGHLSRWAQFPDNSRPELLKGTVMSNLDQMSNWDQEDNEQLNCVEISTVEGDPNVAGVFVAWDTTEDDYNDILLAMTGDMIIRIGAGVTVQRGDLLMSAGDGTAKPQGDDIVRSKTIAKVTSTHVSHTYEDGSYAVPCVLMAC
jgi:hypothetical protein